jgi:predicted nucleic acid-binding protein
MTPRSARVLLDSDCFLGWLREAVRGNPSLPMRSEDGEELCVAFVSVGDAWEVALELKYDAERLNDLRRGIRRFGVLQADERVAEEWGRVITEATALKHPLADAPVHDTWVAATARAGRLPLLTNSGEVFRDFPGLLVRPCPSG